MNDTAQIVLKNARGETREVTGVRQGQKVVFTLPAEDVRRFARVQGGSLLINAAKK